VSIVESLIDAARADTELLIQNDLKGDNFATPRDVEFLLRSPTQENALLVCNFINDHQYGRAYVQERPAGFDIVIVVFMAPQQNILCSISGLMVCLSKLFDVEYDGWGCVIQNSSTSGLEQVTKQT
jgi:hypothetical protein